MLPVYVPLLPWLSVLRAAWLVRTQQKQEMSSLNLNLSLQACPYLSSSSAALSVFLKNDPHRSGNRSIGQPSDLGERLRGDGCLQIGEALLVSHLIAEFGIE